MNGAYLGPKFSENEIEDQLKKLRGKYIKKTVNEISSIIAKELSKAKLLVGFKGEWNLGQEPWEEDQF